MIVGPVQRYLWEQYEALNERARNCYFREISHERQLRRRDQSGRVRTTPQQRGRGA
jgi:hypothetical protein